MAYGYTAISPRGVAFLREFTHQHYRQFMQEWETGLNHYLRTGTELPVPRPVG